MGCGCNKRRSVANRGTSGQRRLTSNSTRGQSNQPKSTSISEATAANRRRIEKLRRDAIKRTFGK